MTEQLQKLTPEDGQSLDIEAQNIEQLKQFFPDVFREGKVDFEALKAALGEHVEDKEERYNFTWHGKNKARQIAQTPSTGTLRPCKEESVNWDTTQNLFIEGDNLEVLKLLQKSYHQKVKMIYIDPPYNTGSDFVYKDDFSNNIKNYLSLTNQVDGQGNTYSTNVDTSGRYHSDWLSMMYPRLKLARNLLKDDGVIFISIDDNEITNLKNICNEIFGEENFVAQMVWKKKYIGGKHAKHFVDLHEYVLVYAKNILDLDEVLMDRPSGELGKFKLEDEYLAERGRYYTRPLKSNLGKRETLIYPIEMPDGDTITTQWMVSKDTFEDLKEKGRIVFIQKRDGTYNVHRKYYEKDGGGKVKVPSLIETVSNADGKIEIKDLFGISEGREIPFDNPKPTDFLNYLIEPVLKDGDTLLDFFAGSASSAHAVYKLNAKDNLNRKYIMVQLPELCDEKSVAYQSGYRTIPQISRERLVKASAKFSENNLDTGFKFLRLDESNIKQWEPNFDNLSDILENSVDSIKSERNNIDVLYEILLKYGLDLTYPIAEHILADKTVYDVAFGSLIVCLDDDISQDVVEEIGKLKQELDSESTRVVLKDSGFADDAVKVNAVQLLKQYGVDDVKSI